jgi:penicillin-binding protein 1A
VKKAKGRTGGAWWNRGASGRTSRFFRKRWLILAGVAGLLVVGLGGILLVAMLLVSPYVKWAWDFDLKQVEEMPQTTIVYDRNGYVLQRMFEENRIFVPFDEIPAVIKNAVIATEDKRFYQHNGFDAVSTLRAAVQNAFGSRIVSGASTITQQLARNSANMSERTIERKLRELFLAIRLEQVYSKDEIMTYYLNRIYFGKQNYGIATATDAYFGKKTSELTLSEAAMLAGIISAPNAFSPWGNAEPVKARAARSRALRRMLALGFITEEEANRTENEPLAIRPIIQHPGSHPVAALRAQLPEFLSRDDLVRGGLRIYTTIDVSFQRAAEAQLEEALVEVEKTRGYRHPTRAQVLEAAGEDGAVGGYLQGAFVAISNRDGGILAMVGGRNFDESTFNRAIFGSRQVGSTLKPFVYATAFNVLNICGFTQVDDSPFDLKLGMSSGAIPVGPFPEWRSVRVALQSSNNYAAMRTAVAAGLDNFAFLVKQASGVEIEPYASSALGACSLTPLELAGAYTIFANGGMKVEPHLITHVTDEAGTVLYQGRAASRRVLSPEIAFQIHSLLAGVINAGTGRAARSTYGLQGELAGKTGTTNDFKDSWFAGYSSEVTSVAWVGFDEPKTVMAGGYASRLALPIWSRIMKLAEPHYTPRPFTPPAGLVWSRPQIDLGLFQVSQPGGAADYLRQDQLQAYLPRIDSLAQPVEEAFASASEFDAPEMEGAMAEAPPPPPSRAVRQERVLRVPTR